jgi:hypothetical protein
LSLMGKKKPSSGEALLGLNYETALSSNTMKTL